MSGDAGQAPPSLADFLPLRRAEQLLLRACARGDIARIGLRRPAVAAAVMTVRAGLLAFLARGGGPGAPVRGRRIQIVGAWIEGRLDLGDCELPFSLWLYRCVFDTTPLFDGARLAGSLSLPDCQLPGLMAERCRIAQDLALNAGCTITEEVRLQRARIGGDLNCSRLRLAGDENGGATRRPLQADGARIGGDLRLDGGLEATGELRFVGARVGGDLLAGRASLTGGLDAGGARGAALVLDRIAVGGDVKLDDGFAAAGRVCLRRVRIAGDLDCSGAAFDRVGDAAWGGGVAFVLDRARVHGVLKLRRLQGPLLGASLAGARVGALVDDATTWGERLVLDGFAYSRFGDGAPLDAAFRLAWLERQPPAHLSDDFRMHPWRRLIEVLQRMGRRHAASEVALRRERRLRRIGRIGESLPRPLRALAQGVHALFGAVAGYGWRPQRLALWAGAVWLAGAALFWSAERHGAMVPMVTPAAVPFSPMAYSLDLLVPLVDLQQHGAWAPASRAAREGGFDWAEGARLLGWFQTLFGWAALLTLLASLAGWTRRDRSG